MRKKFEVILLGEVWDFLDTLEDKTETLVIATLE
jgi:hypothetical protein